MHVIATAGHVDHGKTTLIKALTGIDTDRFAEEKRRGLTIDIGFAWTTLPNGQGVSFVDVPGHERFIGNMLVGLAPVPIVMFIVAADEGWMPQSSDHKDAIKALEIKHGLLVITRIDKAADGGEAALKQARAELSDTALSQAESVMVSAVTKEGLTDLQAALERLIAAAEHDLNPLAPVRFWIDRAFKVKGQGTVVTGTLNQGQIHNHSKYDYLHTDPNNNFLTEVSVRAIESREESTQKASAVSRVALNLRGISAGGLDHELRAKRADVLLTKGAFTLSDQVDVQAICEPIFDKAPKEILVHVGTLALNARLRSYNSYQARIELPSKLPLKPGDILVLRDTGQKQIRGGVKVLEIKAPSLKRRGAAQKRGEVLSEIFKLGALKGEEWQQGQRKLRDLYLKREGFITLAEMSERWFEDFEREHESIAIDDYRLDLEFSLKGAEAIRQALVQAQKNDPLSAGLSFKAAALAVKKELSCAKNIANGVMNYLVSASGLTIKDGLVQDPSVRQDLGEFELAIQKLEAKLKANPFMAPDLNELEELGLNQRHLAAAEKQGRLLRLDDSIVLLPSAPALAMREIAKLKAPFTTAEVRQALNTTRRTVIPLLEYLDKRGWTKRLDANFRQVAR